MPLREREIAEKVSENDKVLDIVIEDPGDPSVGINPQVWTIEKVTIDPELRGEIREVTKEYFENYICDYCIVYFSDELERMSKDFWSNS